MKFVYKRLLPLFIGMALVSCAGADSSAQRKVEERPDLSKAGTPVADTLAAKMPEFALSIFKGSIDSIPGEYYFHATDGRVDTLFKKEDGQYKPVVSIAYDSPNDQSNYELKKGDYNYTIKDDVLVGEMCFPKYTKAYWDNGKTKKMATGILYRDDQGIIQVDSGHSEIYYENGKIYQQNEWRDKQPVAGKQWNEDGVLTVELDYPKSIKEYWDKGNLKETLTGHLYIDDEGNFALDSGHSEIYFENGKIKEQNDWKDKQPVASKQWNENGVLIIELDFPKSTKEYWDNGKIRQLATGILYRADHGGLRVDSGHSEVYFENGKIQQQNDWKGKLPTASREWNENGVLIKELDFSKYYKEYWDNGTPKCVMTGLLYRDDQGFIKVDSGHSESYFENGKTKEQNDWKDKQAIASKQWNEEGVLVVELDFPKYFKKYWDNGNLKEILTGLLYINDEGDFALDSGHSETYFENGKNYQKNDWRDKQGVASKQWNENGVLTVDLDFPKYFKKYWDNGKPKEIITGLLYRDDQGVFRADSGQSETYFENGKIEQKNEWKNKQLVAQKEWNENGTLTKDIEVPKHFKEYWDNGKPKTIVTGILYMDSQGSIQLESGHSEKYSERGKILEQSDYKDSILIAGKTWHKNGTLELDFKFPEYKKIYSDNGTLLFESVGTLYRDEQNEIQVQDGFRKYYHENGQMIVYENFKDKKIIAKKMWQENGKLEYEFVFPKYEKFYSDNGDIYIEKNGTLYYDDQNDIQIQDGYWKAYYENRQMSLHENYKEKKLISRKVWYENGTLKVEGDVSRGFYKKYLTNGKLSMEVSGKFYFDDDGEVILENASEKDWYENGVIGFEIHFPKSRKVYFPDGTLLGEETGTLYYDEQKEIQIQDGARKTYYHDNGKLSQKIIYKKKKLVGKTVWNENGIVTILAELPNRYREFYDDGKLKVEVTGTIVEDDGSFNIKDGIYKEYAPNGESTYSATYKDFQRISEK